MTWSNWRLLFREVSSDVIQEPLCPLLLLLGFAGSVAIVHGYAVRKFRVYLLEPL